MQDTCFRTRAQNFDQGADKLLRVEAQLSDT